MSNVIQFEEWLAKAEAEAGFPIRTERARNAFRIGQLSPQEFARTMGRDRGRFTPHPEDAA